MPQKILKLFVISLTLVIINTNICFAENIKDIPLPLNEKNVTGYGQEMTHISQQKFPPSFTPIDQAIRIFKDPLEKKYGYSFDKTFRFWLVYNIEFAKEEKLKVLSDFYSDLFNVILNNAQEAFKKNLISEKTYELIKEIKKNPKIESNKKLQGMIASEKKYFHQNQSPAKYNQHLEKGLLLAQKGNFDAAINEMKKAIELNPNDELSHFNLGLVYMKKGKSDDAIPEFGKAIEINPGNAGNYFILGNVWVNKGDMDEARMLFEKAIEVDPKFGKAYASLGYLYMAHNNNSEAMKYFNKSCELGEQDICQKLGKKK